MSAAYVPPSAAEKNAKVLAVLIGSKTPIGPTEIACRINEPWCCYSGFGQSASISPILKRIGAVRHKGGLYTKPEAS